MLTNLKFQNFILNVSNVRTKGKNFGIGAITGKLLFTLQSVIDIIFSKVSLKISPVAKHIVVKF